jgi:hypothetical protein
MRGLVIRSLGVWVLTVFVGCGPEAVTPPTSNSCSAATCSGCCQGDECIEQSISLASSATCGWGAKSCAICLSTESCNNGQCEATSSGGCASCLQGCCQNGNCVGGSAASACGSSGLACSICKTGEVCNEGRCVSGTNDCSTCGGCCANGTACLDGSSKSACGTGGEVCKTCDPDDACNAGECLADSTPDCDHTTCSDGCCSSSGLCIQYADQGNSQCGTGAATCMNCTDFDPAKTCDAQTHGCKSGGSGNNCGSCQASECCDSNACAPGTTNAACGKGGTCQVCPAGTSCQNQQCAATTTKLYEVYLVSTKVESPWTSCLESKCDLYVVLKFGSTSKTSQIIANNNEPYWGELMLTASETDLLGNALEVTIKDDAIGYDMTVGTCSFVVTATELAAGAISGPCPDLLTAGAKEIAFSFKAI